MSVELKADTSCESKLNRMIDTPIFNIKFVELVKKYPELYDVFNENYACREAAQEAWMRVARELNEDVEECKKRWRHLRQALSRHLKKIHEGSASALAKPYYLAKYMDFVACFMTHRDKLALNESDVCTNNSRLDMSDWQDATIKTEISLDEEATRLTIPDDSITIEGRVGGSSPEDFSPPEPKRRHVETSNTTSNHQQQSKPTEVKSTIQHDVMFFQSILPEMSFMTPMQKQIFKTKVMNLITETLYPSSVSQISNSCPTSDHHQQNRHSTNDQ